VLDEIFRKLKKKNFNKSICRESLLRFQLRAETGRDSSRDSGRELIRDLVLVDPVLIEQDREGAHDPDEGDDEQTGWKQKPFSNHFSN
jgi:hypothetical protein